MRVSINVSSDGINVAADLARLEGLTETLPTTLAQVAADYGEPAVKTAAREVRGTLSMSNNREARELGTLPIVRAGSPHAEAEIVAVPRGAWHLVEYGSKPHDIDTKRGYGGKAKRKGMPTPYATAANKAGIYSKVHHPGTAGTQTWTKAMEAAEPLIDAAVQDAFEAAVNPDTSGAV